MATITSVNSVFMLSILPLYPAPQKLQGYSADDAFATEAVDIAEIVLGVDGGISAGFIPYLIKQTISIMPDSPSSLIFETWAQAEKAAQEKFWATAQIALVSTGRKYAMTRGVLSNFMAIPDAKKTLQARRFVITWGGVDPAIF